MSTSPKNVIAKKTATKKATATTKKVAPKKTITKAVAPVKKKAPVHHELFTPDVIKSLSDLKEYLFNGGSDILHICDTAMIHDNRAGLSIYYSNKPVKGSGTWTIKGKERVTGFKNAIAQTLKFIDMAKFLPGGKCQFKDDNDECDFMCELWDELETDTEMIRDIFAVSMFFKDLAKGEINHPLSIIRIAETLNYVERVHTAFKEAINLRDKRIATERIAELNAKFPALKMSFMFWSLCEATTKDGGTKMYYAEFYRLDCKECFYMADRSTNEKNRDGKYFDLSDILTFKILPKENEKQ